MRLVDLKNRLKKYDSDGSGNSDEKELRHLLAHYDNGLGMKSDWNKYHTEKFVQNIGSVDPTSEEISWLLEAGKKHKPTSVDVSEIGFILDLWHSYVLNRARLEEFDTDQPARALGLSESSSTKYIFFFLPLFILFHSFPMFCLFFSIIFHFLIRCDIT